MMSCSMPWVTSSTLNRPRRMETCSHVFANLLDRLGKGDGGAFLVQQIQGAVRLDHDERFLAAEAGGLDFVVVAAVGVGDLVEPDGSLVDLDLHREHFTEAGLEHGQDPFDLLLAKLTEDFFEFELGGVEVFERLLLFVGGTFAVGLFEPFLSGAHFFFSGLNAFTSRVLLVGLILIGRTLALAAFALAFAFSFTLALPFTFAFALTFTFTLALALAFTFPFTLAFTLARALVGRLLTVFIVLVALIFRAFLVGLFLVVIFFVSDFLVSVFLVSVFLVAGLSIALTFTFTFALALTFPFAFSFTLALAFTFALALALALAFTFTFTFRLVRIFIGVVGGGILGFQFLDVVGELLRLVGFFALAAGEVLRIAFAFGLAPDPFDVFDHLVEPGDDRLELFALAGGSFVTIAALQKLQQLDEILMDAQLSFTGDVELVLVQLLDQIDEPIVEQPLTAFGERLAQ